MTTCDMIAAAPLIAVHYRFGELVLTICSEMATAGERYQELKTYGHIHIVAI